MLVRGLLGVVSSLELIFFFLFIALIVWTFVYVNIITPVMSNMNARQNSRHAHDKMWQQKFRSTGFYFAVAGNICSALLFFPVTRVSSILPLLGLTSDGSIKYHMLIYRAFGHVLLHHARSNMLKWDGHSVSNVHGELALLFGLVLWVTSHPRIRRKSYELFFYAHHLYIPFMFFYMLHTGIHFFCMILPGLYLFLVDRYLRFLQSRRKVRLISARVLPCEAVELNFSKSPGT
ncbi:hypothetical protein H6P81_008378 [Aristolochia fimbriata]|uniref:Ferric oxidoreductase domain-containing protein n=1 Tax=Aristolochia fimbriata TaxID=158543 RepID=A0AAV7F3J4_ARIFI|nr:hypothetical protein H6P81_008378 [Aristolochia fimbriata]